MRGGILEHLPSWEYPQHLEEQVKPISCLAVPTEICARDLRADTDPAFPEWERWELYSGTVHQNKSLWGIPEAALAPGTAHTEVLLPPREEKLGLKRSQCLQQPRAGQGPRSDTPRSLQGSGGFTSPAPSVPPQHHPTAGATATSTASLGQQPGMGTERWPQ